MPNRYTNPKLIKETLDEYVMGQEKGTKAVAMAMAQHLRQIESRKYFPRGNFPSDNVLIIGPTGCGKTETVRVLQKIEEEIECPVLMFNILDYAATKTWLGDSITNIFDKIIERACQIYYNKYGKNAKINEQEKEITNIANNAIIFLDEFDKIAIDSEGRTRQFLKEYQSNLLKIIEGNTYEITLTVETEEEKPNTKEESSGNSTVTTVTLDSTNMMFVLLGAFDGIQDITLNRLESERRKKEKSNKPKHTSYQDTTLGFMVRPHPQPEKPKYIKYTYEQMIPSQEDIIQYGFMRELVGRIAVRTVYKPLSTDNLIEILLNSRTSAYREYQRRFRQDNLDLKCNRDALREIAKIAVSRGTGARGLRTIFDELCRETLYDLAGDQRFIRCLLRGKEIREHKPPLLHDRTQLEILQHFKYWNKINKKTKKQIKEKQNKNPKIYK